MRLPKKSSAFLLFPTSLAALFGASVAVFAPTARGETCLTAPGTASNDPPRAIYEAAQRNLQAKRWEAAAQGFRGIALDHPSEGFALASATAYLESLNGLARDEKRVDCYGTMARDLPRLVELYCAGEKAKMEPEACERFDAIGADLERLSAQESVRKADQTKGPRAQALYETAARTYVEAFRKRCETPNGKAPAGLHCDELAYNGAHAYRAAGLAPQAIDAFRRLVSYDGLGPPEGRTRGQSPLTQKAIRELGGIYQSLTQYELAAEQYEQYVRLYPSAVEAPDLLAEAILWRLGLGEAERASVDATLFLKGYGASKSARAIEMHLAVAWYHERHEDWTRVAATLSSVAPLVERAPLDLYVRAKVLMAHAHAEGPPATRGLAATENSAVVARWGKGDTAMKSIEAAWPGEDEGTHMWRLGRALTAVGEAMFANAEARRLAEVETLKPPMYAGPANEVAIRTYVDTRVKEWMTKKSVAIESVSEAYAGVLRLAPVPPPKWTASSSAQVAAMWANLHAELGRIFPPSVNPLLHKGKKLTPLGVAFEDVRSFIQQGRANPANVRCVDLASKFSYADDRTRACEAWLVKTGTRHATDELVPRLRSASPVVYSPLLSSD
jgi:outer membrane protein assembly factor BamD (BamD/ComL family)